MIYGSANSVLGAPTPLLVVFGDQIGQLELYWKLFSSVIMFYTCVCHDIGKKWVIKSYYSVHS